MICLCQIWHDLHFCASHIQVDQSHFSRVFIYWIQRWIWHTAVVWVQFQLVKCGSTSQEINLLCFANTSSKPAIQTKRAWCPFPFRVALDHREVQRAYKLTLYSPWRELNAGLSLSYCIASICQHPTFASTVWNDFTTLNESICSSILETGYEFQNVPFGLFANQFVNRRSDFLWHQEY